jgi:hypothetical protein
VRVVPEAGPRLRAKAHAAGPNGGGPRHLPLNLNPAASLSAAVAHTSAAE